MGLFNSIMFPSIFTLGLRGLGPLTGEGSGLLVAAIVGGAIVPEIQAIFADRIGIHHAFFSTLSAGAWSIHAARQYRQCQVIFLGTSGNSTPCVNTKSFGCSSFFPNIWADVN